MSLLLAPVLSLGLAVAQPGLGCGSFDDKSVILFHDLPPRLARGNAVLNVDFGEGAVAKPGEPMVARVKSVIRGRFDRGEVPVIYVWNRCSDPFADGASGLLIGRFAKQKDGTPIFYPVEETFGERRKRRGKFADGWSKPDDSIPRQTGK